MKRILSLNMNAFGGSTETLMEHRYYNNRDRMYHIDWKYWAQNVNKAETWMKLIQYLSEKQPDIIIFEEFLVSCYERIDFIGEFKALGYQYMEETLPERGNYSLTMIFYREGNLKHIKSPGGYREYRSAVCKAEGLLLCGSHFPSESDEKFLYNMEQFITDKLDEDFLLIGDLNANDPARGNKIMINRLLKQGAIDLWVDFGGAENTPTEARYKGRLDYAIASPSLEKKVQNIEIDPSPMDDAWTNHAAIIVDLMN